MTIINPEVYAGNPALKLPILRRNGSVLFGAQNIWPRHSRTRAAAPKRIVWPETLRDDLSRNAQGARRHCMAKQGCRLSSERWSTSCRPTTSISWAGRKAAWGLASLARLESSRLARAAAAGLESLRGLAPLRHRAPHVSRHARDRSVSVAGWLPRRIRDAPVGEAHRLRFDAPPA